MTALDPQEQTIKISFKANPVQKRFILSQAKADFFSARMGEGKSAGLVWACYHHTKHNPGARWMMIRDTWENLRDTTLVEFMDWFRPMGEWKANEKSFYWKVGEMRGIVQFRGLDEEKDAHKLQSRPLAAFGMDEPAPAAESGGIAQMIFDTAMTRLRQKDMKWYVAKLAANNPDESHWTYKKFIKPGTPGYVCHQTEDPENLANLPDDYYETIRNAFADRLDLVDRFVLGKYGFQRRGRPVTPAWNDDLHLGEVGPVPGVDLHLLWDFGLTPVVLITQFAPDGHWNFIEALQGEDIGTIEHIEENVRPTLTSRYGGYNFNHIIDPAGEYRDQTSSANSPAAAIRAYLGGAVIQGPEAIEAGVDPLNYILGRVLNDGRGVIQVDDERSIPLWHALRGGWHYPQHSNGIIGSKPVKNMASHPGDAARYGAGHFFPAGRLKERRRVKRNQRTPKYFSSSIVRGRPGKIPKEAETLGVEDVHGG